MKNAISLSLAVSVVLVGLTTRAQTHDVTTTLEGESAPRTTSAETESMPQDTEAPSASTASPSPQARKGFPINPVSAVEESTPPTEQERSANLWGASRTSSAEKKDQLSPEERRRRLWGHGKEQTSESPSASSHEERLLILRGGHEKTPSDGLLKAKLEYSAFLDKEYERYRRRVGGGAALVVLGGVALISALAVALSYAVPPAVESFSDVGSHDTDNPGSNGGDGSSYRWVLPVSLLAVGLAGIAAGIPLIVTGREGIRRTRHLRELNSGSSSVPATASASASFILTVNHGQPSGGLRFEVDF
jgi:hypothetical protein